MYENNKYHEKLQCCSTIVHFHSRISIGIHAGIQDTGYKRGYAATLQRIEASQRTYIDTRIQAHTRERVNLFRGRIEGPPWHATIFFCPVDPVHAPALALFSFHLPLYFSPFYSPLLSPCLTFSFSLFLWVSIPLVFFFLSMFPSMTHAGACPREGCPNNPSRRWAKCLRMCSRSHGNAATLIPRFDKIQILKTQNHLLESSWNSRKKLFKRTKIN